MCVLIGTPTEFIGQRTRWQKVDQSEESRQACGRRRRTGLGVEVGVSQLFVCLFSICFRFRPPRSQSGSGSVVGRVAKGCRDKHGVQRLYKGAIFIFNDYWEIFFSLYQGFRLVPSSYPQWLTRFHCCQFNNVTSETCAVKYILGGHKFYRSGFELIDVSSLRVRNSVDGGCLCWWKGAEADNRYTPEVMYDNWKS